MKYKLQTLLILIIFAFAGNTALSGQFDDLYYDPDKDFQFSQEEEYQVYEDDDYYDDSEYENDSYYDDYDYATRINRFRRSTRTFGYFSSCYMLNRWNSFGFDPYYDPYYNNFHYDNYYSPGTSIYISFGNSYGWNRWNRWNSYRPWYASWHPGYYNSWGYNSWGPSYGYGNSYFANNYYYGNNFNHGYQNNHSYYNNYDRVSNPNGVYYGSRNARSTVASSKGKLKSPRGTVDYNKSRVTDNNTNAIKTNRKSYRKGDITSSTSRTNNRIYERKNSNIDQRRKTNTYRGSTSSRTKSSGTINRGSTRTNVYKGTTSRTKVNRGTSSRIINRNNTSSRKRSVNPRTNTSRNTRSFNTTRSSNRSSSSVNRSSTRSSNNRSSSSTRSTSSRKKNN